MTTDRLITDSLSIGFGAWGMAGFLHHPGWLILAFAFLAVRTRIDLESQR